MRRCGRVLLTYQKPLVSQKCNGKGGREGVAVQFDDAIVCGDVDDATAELVGQGGECL
jgi:hypothetical protein